VALVIDTSVLIDIERGPAAIETLTARTRRTAGMIAAITLAEMRLGEHLASPAVRARARAEFVDAVAARFTVLPFGAAEAEEYARLSAWLRRAGTPIGDHDLQIAATAIAGSHQLMTLNKAEFGRVPGLTLVDS
jgi:predicted nucleic acid-binding protein